MKENTNKYIDLPPFKGWILENFPFIEEDFDAITNYQMMCKVIGYLKVVMENNNYIQYQEIKPLYDAFESLKDYVDNYFENLDVQEEINNKLDDMAEHGELAEIIAQYLQVNSVLGFDTKSDLKSAENLIDGSITKTLGDELYNDGKGNYYKIRSLESGDVIDDDNILALSNYPTLIAEKIPDYRLNTLESIVDTIINTTLPAIEDEINDINKLPLYNVLLNGGDATGTDDVTGILSNAYSNGYYRFYFPQNETRDAIYKIADNVNFSNYEILTDDGVILSLKNAYSVKGGKYLSNVKCYCRAEDNNMLIPKNVGDLFNSCHLGINYNKEKVRSFYTVSQCTLVIYDYNNDGQFKVHSNPITNYYTDDGIYYKLTNNPTFNAVCLPVVDTGNCVETNADGINQTLQGIICNTSTGQGLFVTYNGSTFSWYDETKASGRFTELNIHKHNKPNNNFALPVSYKMKYNKENNTVDLFVNDMLVTSKILGFEPNYFGWGTSTNNIKFTRLVRYYQKNVPMNYKLNILIAGDSRFDNNGRPYQIENILENSLKYNAINSLNIDNKAVSGLTLSQIKSLIEEQDPSEYDIVIIEGGINNYGSNANEIANTTAGIIQYCVENGIIPILPTCMPTAVNGSDTHSGDRAEKYYMITNAMTIGYGTVQVPKGALIDNMNGNVMNESSNAVNPDGVHPSCVGVIEIAKGITYAILTL